MIPIEGFIEASKAQHEGIMMLKSMTIILRATLGCDYLGLLFLLHWSAHSGSTLIDARFDLVDSALSSQPSLRAACSAGLSSCFMPWWLCGFDNGAVSRTASRTVDLRPLPLKVHHAVARCGLIEAESLPDARVVEDDVAVEPSTDDQQLASDDEGLTPIVALADLKLGAVVLLLARCPCRRAQRSSALAALAQGPQASMGIAVFSSTCAGSLRQASPRMASVGTSSSSPQGLGDPCLRGSAAPLRCIYRAMPMSSRSAAVFSSPSSVAASASILAPLVRFDAQVLKGKRCGFLGHLLLVNLLETSAAWSVWLQA